ncbi:MAG: hypothetical protein WKH64_04675 [Chloroflexia bacterium]
MVGANGALVGYGGGLETKRRLLEIEAEGWQGSRTTAHTGRQPLSAPKSTPRRPAAPHQTAKPPT